MGILSRLGCASQRMLILTSMLDVGAFLRFSHLSRTGHSGVGKWQWGREIGSTILAGLLGNTNRFSLLSHGTLMPIFVPIAHRRPIGYATSSPISRVQSYPLRQSSAFGKVLCRFTPKNASTQTEHDTASCGKSGRIRPGGPLGALCGGR